MDAQTYLETVKQELAICSKICSVDIIDERVILPTHGYFRARLALTNGDFLEISEYFISEEGQCNPRKYRYQWMNNSLSCLIKRWDNANHFPNLPSYPYHVHVGSEDNVFSSKPLSIIEIIDIIGQEIE